MSILSIEHISYSYEDGTKALKDVSFSVEPGEKTAFIGANGSGKSTTFLCLNGILKPQAGRILYKDKPISYSKKELLSLRSKVGIVFQEPDNQLFAASVVQEISFGLFNMKLPRCEIEKKVEAIVDYMGITPFAQKPVHLLSGGQKKQVALADILVMEPEVLLMDEPVSALDPVHTVMLHEKITELPKEGITIIVSTHDLDFALQWADKIVVFHQGLILKSGSPEEIFMDKELLVQAELIQPKVIELYTELTERGVLRENLPVPKDFQILKNYMIEAYYAKI
ncbi:hypothetical protein acsn021_39730 [Anaerocolumna cellulosilytica]|uniref:ABC transporter ATP-binding protein n=1 Tax=Anaerocolumna cellulosilytica TaxID=433286 RepID=A0A6S6R0G4_9FIRM|nr:ATP-binding cassette domain-containing protein [Anaerocolumna cellulosilytica]MBB5196377.1 cobalt/nickel transport system ATP-binding protein [Anaerocolumna cellulosilytica]BCJ96404.1 hypothetical protein acsn021_39730 [Anaerocolumna cellulosilytica]